MMFVVSAIFVLLEAARLYGLRQYAHEKSTQAGACAAAEYEPYLWDEFHVLMLDGSYGGADFEIGTLAGRIKCALDENLSQNKTFFSMRADRMFEPSYVLATDQNGAVFLHMAAAFMKESITTQAAQEIYEKYTNQNEVQKENTIEEDAVENAGEMLARAKEDADSSQEIETVEENENPLEAAAHLKKAMKSSVLGFVLEDTSCISQKEMNLENEIQRRQLNQGTSEIEIQSDWYEKVLVLEYAKDCLSSYANVLQHHSASYELEYLIGGKEADSENLEKTVQNLIAYRCAANAVFVLSDFEMMQKAQTIAAALAGFTANPVIIKTVETAIVGAWAYLESVQDVRTLLAGGKIALLKNKQQWTTDLNHLLDCFSVQSKAKECENGLNYEDYLKQLLFLLDEQTFAYRLLNVVEQNLKCMQENENVRMDFMIVQFNYETELLAEPLFSAFSLLGNGTQTAYYIRELNEFCYIP